MSNNASEFWRSLFSARGRNGRGRYWKVVGLVLLAFLVSGVFAEFAADPSPLWMKTIVAIVVAVIMLAAIYANILNHIKRLHDLGRSGWWLLAVIAATLLVSLLMFMGPSGRSLGGLYQLVALFVFGGHEGQPGPNRFGDPPGQASKPDETAAAA